MPATMVDSKYSKMSPEGRNQTENSSLFHERRTSPRYPFTAGVTAVEPASQTEVEAHTADLSARGCYVDAMTPFPAGTELNLRLTKNGKSFHTKVRVIYGQAGVGMGLLFIEIAPAQRFVLKKWFSELRGESLPEPIDASDDRAPNASASESDERYVIEDLVVLLIQKHVLTEDEGETILRRLSQ
jgi:PilZ domain